MAAGVTMRQMLEAGVHFGHQTRRWNPHMKRFIFTERNGIHILDLAQTVARLDAALEKVREVVSAGDQVLFVGTKKQARGILQQEAERSGMPFVNTRWLGGTLTNFITIARRIEHFKQLETRVLRGDEAMEAEGLTKRERMVLMKEYERLERSLGGLRNMSRLPGLIFVVDPSMEENAVREANRAGVPIVAMCDTNADPDLIQFPVPSNDDAIRAIQLMTGRIADAVVEGIAVGEVEQQFQARATGAPDAPPSAAAPADEAGEQP
ncbi:MAG: 30S ribosomal protein S2 [Dehalococcoidia bacterium]|nr:30S ribosomal protein S2 [Dehalococcoidia bacterium]